MVRSRRAMLGTVCGVAMAVLAGCSDEETETTDTEPASTETETASATDRDTDATETKTPASTASNHTATIQYDGGSVTLDAYGEASVELHYSTSGGAVAETDFSTIGQPTGSGAGVLEYDEYAELQFDTRGEYVIQLTVTFEDGTLARDTVDITVE